MVEKTNLWNTQIIGQALVDSFRKLDPRWMVKNPVMFVVEVGSVLTSALLVDNAIALGYLGDDDGALAQANRLLALDPSSTPDPTLSLPVEQREPGGLGILLIRRMVDRVEYRRVGGENLLRLEKSLG